MATDKQPKETNNDIFDILNQLSKVGNINPIQQLDDLGVLLINRVRKSLDKREIDINKLSIGQLQDIYIMMLEAQMALLEKYNTRLFDKIKLNQS